MMDVLFEEMYRKSLKEFDTKLKFYVMKNLSAMGYEFETEESFLDFVKNHVLRVSHINWARNYYELRLDDGKLIGSYYDHIEVTNDGAKYTITIGQPNK